MVTISKNLALVAAAIAAGAAGVASARRDDYETNTHSLETLFGERSQGPLTFFVDDAMYDAINRMQPTHRPPRLMLGKRRGPGVQNRPPGSNARPQNVQARKSRKANRSRKSGKLHRPTPG